MQQKPWIALLRAVNLGGRNRVPMAELREVLAALGFGSVRTYIASGNVLLTAGSNRAAVTEAVEAAIAGSFGVATSVALRAPSELDRLLDRHPFGAETSASFVSFLTAKPSAAAVRKLAALDVAPDRAHVAGSDVYLHYPNGVTAAKLSIARVERTLGVPGTARTWATVAKLAELGRELG